MGLEPLGPTVRAVAKASMTVGESLSTCNEVCLYCDGRGLRLARTPAGEIVEIGCECPLGEPWRHKTAAEIAIERRLQRLYQEPALASYRGARLSDFPPRLGREVHRIIAEARRGLYVSGPTGVGKTHLACALVNELAAGGLSCWAVVVPAWLDQIRSAYDDLARRRAGEVVPGLQTPREIALAPAQVEVLVLDDLGVEKLTPWVAEQLYELVQARYLQRERLLTIVTSNLSLGELEQRFAGADLELHGRRIVSRLRGMCEPVALQGRDRRLPRGSERP